MTPADYHAAGVINANQARVLELRYGRHQMSQHSVALALGLSRSRVREIEKRALQLINLHNQTEAA